MQPPLPVVLKREAYSVAERVNPVLGLVGGVGGGSWPWFDKHVKGKGVQGRW